MPNDTLYAPNQPIEPKGDEIHLINPSMQEFKTSYLDDKNHEVQVILEPLQAKEFPMSIGLTVLKHLQDFILNQQGFSYKTDVNLELAKIREKCVLYE
jgi:hypothetical protein